MGIHDDHRQRVYERFLREGLEGFEEHNAMEFLLFLARARGDTNPLAHELVNRFGSLAEVLDAPIEELEKTPGVGHSTAVVLKFIPQMCAYYLQNKKSHKKIMLDSVQAASDFFFPKFMARTQEAVYIAMVDDRRRLLHCSLLAEGTFHSASIQMDKLMRETMYQGTTGVFLAHNHPFGMPMPSFEDMEMTRQIYKMLKMVNITLLDHLIFANDEYVSFAERKFMDQIKNEKSSTIR